MQMNGISSLLFQMLMIILACLAIGNYADESESDIDCLRSIKESLDDPENLLSSWDFSNNPQGFICRFTGIECWHPDESKVLNIRLSDMGLRGQFPIGLKKCTSLTGLDLSNNNLTGHIPSSVADVLPFVTTLDLSNNNLSGSIPHDIDNLSFINVLRLNNNQLTGQIPPGLSDIKRLKIFNVANNRLSGKIPIFGDGLISPECYENNLGLCGAPLSPCENHHDLFFSGFVVGLPVFTAISTLFILCCLPRLSNSNMRSSLSMIKKIKGRKHHPIPQIAQVLFKEENNTEHGKITTMEKYVRRLSLEELKLATNDFDIKNVIGFGNMGLMYKAVLTDGLILAVKRLHKFESFEKEFLLEIEILGRLRLINLVPLLGFCFEMGNKFLVYKYMSNGTLHQWLHSKPQIEGTKMGWSLRLRIAVGIARGLAWLHHNKVLHVAHLKISSKCILLDDKFEPKISNLGYSNVLMNTSGCTFVDPHSSPGSYKEDVYSFGILLLELVSGREWPYEETDSSMRDNVFGEEFNTIEEHLIGQGFDGDTFNMIDEHLIGHGFDNDIYETLRIAKKCIRSHNDGATSMLEVYQSICAIGMSSNEIFDNSPMDLESIEEDM